MFVRSVVKEHWDGETVRLDAVRDGDNPENNSFFEATPAGHHEMTINNPLAYGVFRQGQEYYVDFSLAGAGPEPESTPTPPAQPESPVPPPAAPFAATELVKEDAPASGSGQPDPDEAG